MPNAKVDLLVGSNVIGSATAGADGDFAVVLDDPLKPGDYQIVLRATAPDNVVAMSVETAVVSVPETPDGQVLALVEEPGKPSQMITLPEPQPPAAAAKPPLAAAPPAAEAPPVAEAPAAEPKPEGEMQAALPEQTEPAPPPATPPPAGPMVRVEAVEIDGRKIFVAGAADPGRTVRGYANEILLGDAKASPDGRYLIEAERNLPVGDYIIRVDALEPDGVKVAARAAVPFEREPGETIAAVAPPSGSACGHCAWAGCPGNRPASRGSEAPSGRASRRKRRRPTAPASPAPETPAAAAEAPPQREARRSLRQKRLPQPEAPRDRKRPSRQPPAQPPAAEAPAPTAEAPAMPAPDQPAAAGDGTPTAEQPAESAATAGSGSRNACYATGCSRDPCQRSARPRSEAPAAGAPPAGADVAAAPAGEGALPAPPPAGVGEVLAPKLQSVDSAVIIRRGDSLWRISRRVYGRGVRYSTIYLANQTQIEDPDRIWPGQVFKVPEKSADGEADADYSTLGDRLTTVPKEGEQATDPAQAQQ